VAEDHAESPDQGAKNSSLQVSCGILEGLAGCIVGCEHGVKVGKPSFSLSEFV